MNSMIPNNPSVSNQKRRIEARMMSVDAHLSNHYQKSFGEPLASSIHDEMNFLKAWLKTDQSSELDITKLRKLALQAIDQQDRALAFQIARLVETINAKSFEKN